MNKKKVIAIAIAVVFVFLLVGGSEISKMFNSSSNSFMQQSMQINDEVVGSGTEAVTGKKVTVNYTGYFTNGEVFDSSYERNTPFTFTLGAGEVIEGWDSGILGMKVDGKRILIIPADFAYGSQDVKDSLGNVIIPANSTLIFEVELLEVK